MIDFGVTYYRTGWKAATAMAPFLAPKLAPKVLPTVELAVQLARRSGRGFINPWSRKLSHSFQYIRHLPLGLRLPLEIGREIAPWAHLLVEGSERELRDELRSAGVELALVLPNRTIDGEPAPDGGMLATRGTPIPNDARAVYSRAADLTDALVDEAEARGLPLWIPAPRKASIAALRGALADHPRATFVLEGLNFDHTEIAFELGREHANLFFTTTHQPLEVISEGVRRLGSERLLFASGWPYLGESIESAAAEVRSGVDEGQFAVEVADQILHGNARALLALRKDPA